VTKPKAKTKGKTKTSGKSRAVLWTFALFVYGAGLWMFLTALAPQILELMRKLGVWEGLAIAGLAYMALLLLVPGLISAKFKKTPFGKITFAWGILALGIAVFVAPVQTWMSDRGSFVPALVWGPDSAVVQRVVVEKLKWGEGWKKRPV
jgi:hypothetical protein